MFALSKAVDLNYLVQGGKPFRAFLFSKGSLFQLILTLVEHLMVRHSVSGLLVFPANIQLPYNSLLWANNLAYFGQGFTDEEKCFIMLTLGQKSTKIFENLYL